MYVYVGGLVWRNIKSGRDSYKVILSERQPFPNPIRKSSLEIWPQILKSGGRSSRLYTRLLEYQPPSKGISLSPLILPSLSLSLVDFIFFPWNERSADFSYETRFLESS